MKKIFSLILFLLFMVIFSSCGSNKNNPLQITDSAFTQKQKINSDPVIFYDDFEDGIYTDKWTISEISGNYQILEHNGYLHIFGSGTPLFDGVDYWGEATLYSPVYANGDKEISVEFDLNLTGSYDDASKIDSVNGGVFLAGEENTFIIFGIGIANHVGGLYASYYDSNLPDKILLGNVSSAVGKVKVIYNLDKTVTVMYGANVWNIADIVPGHIINLKGGVFPVISGSIRTTGYSTAVNYLDLKFDNFIFSGTPVAPLEKIITDLQNLVVQTEGLKNEMQNTLNSLNIKNYGILQQLDNAITKLNSAIYSLQTRQFKYCGNALLAAKALLYRDVLSQLTYSGWAKKIPEDLRLSWINILNEKALALDSIFKEIRKYWDPTGGRRPI